jgi:tRNA 5-methylaminomethyl-2-thiouridine biosynthesis bifunctional protein
MSTAHVPAPALDYVDDTPVSSAFGDVYFSRAGGVAETEHVFLKGNGLPGRWQSMIEGGLAPYAALTPAASGSPWEATHTTPVADAALAHRRFTIAELGFGTGLNFLVTLKNFRKTAPAAGVLHYIAIEKYPFTPDRLRAVLALQPELAEEAGELLAAYPLRLPGLHRIHLPRCVLTLCFGEVEAMLKEVARCPLPVAREVQEKDPLPLREREGPTQWEGEGAVEKDGIPLHRPLTQPSPARGEGFIDAWYLDGFSPAKNPEMWSTDILARVGALSAAGTTFATFTSAGEVRRGLMAAGFAVQKVPGFGHKREMLVGVMGCPLPVTREGNASKSSPLAGEAMRLSEQREISRSGEGAMTGDSQTSAAPSPSPLPQGERAFIASPPQPSPYGGGGSPILVIGAGIAGATLARALAERGYRVTVLERGRVAQGASGNRAGVLFPQLTKQWNTSTAWYFTAYGFALRQLARWKAQGLVFAHGTPGMLRLPRDADEEAQLRTLHETLGLDASIVHWLERAAASAQAGVELHTGAAFFPEGTWIAPPEICRALLQHNHILLREEHAAIAVTRDGDGWAVTLTGGEVLAARHVCITSAHESAELLADYGLRLHAVGGQVTEYVAGDAAPRLRSILCHKGYVIPCVPSINSYLMGATYHREDMLAVTAVRHEENLQQLQRIVPQLAQGQVVGGRSAIRATTPDRMPYVGAVDVGLYVSTGHGSRGLLSAPLAAEMIAGSIAGEIMPVTQAMVNAVNPMRFRQR